MRIGVEVSEARECGLERVFCERGTSLFQRAKLRVAICRQVAWSGSSPASLVRQRAAANGNDAQPGASALVSRQAHGQASRGGTDHEFDACRALRRPSLLSRFVHARQTTLPVCRVASRRSVA